jgi:hypothetical protein
MRHLYTSGLPVAILGLAILACFTGPAAGAAPTAAEEPFEIVYQNDGLMWMVHRSTHHYPRWQELAGLKAERFHREIDKYADCGVPSVSFGNWSVGNSFNRPTKVGRPFAAGIPDEKIAVKTHVQLKHDLADYLSRGIDPLREVVNHAHRRGMTITVEFRMNNGAPGGTLKSPSPAGPGYNGLLWYEKPEWRLTDPPADPNAAGEPNPGWDYAMPAVREYYLQVIKEVLDNYDVDGIDLSFYQNPGFFNLAEPNKVEHMTDFVKAVRRECDVAGERLGRRLLLTVLMWDKIYGREALKDDGLDVANWSKAGLIDRLVVLTHQIPWADTSPTWDIKPYVEMVKGTGCKIYAGCERRKHGVYKQIEDASRALGVDGMFYFNYEVLPGSPFEEYRSQNASYHCDIEPAKAPNAWAQSDSGNIAMANTAAELSGDVTVWRDAAMLPTGGPGVTMEATLRALNAPTTGRCGFRIATGARTATLGFNRKGLVLLDGDTRVTTIELDPKATHTIRLAIDRTHKVTVYIDNQPHPVATATLVKPTVGERITWGHLDDSAPSAARSRWQAVHYTLEGAFSPTERSFR